MINETMKYSGREFPFLNTPWRQAIFHIDHTEFSIIHLCEILSTYKKWHKINDLFKIVQLLMNLLL